MNENNIFTKDNIDKNSEVYSSESLEDLLSPEDEEEEYQKFESLCDLLEESGITNTSASQDEYLVIDNHTQLLLDFIDTNEDEEDYVDLNSAALVIKNPVQYSLTHYVADNELALINDRVQRVNTLMKYIKSEDTDEAKLFKQWGNFLESPECQCIPGATSVFRSVEYKSSGNFHKYIIDKFMNLLQERKSPNDVLDYQKLVQGVRDIIDKERFLYLLPSMNEIEVAIFKFSQFAEAAYRAFYYKELSLDEIKFTEDVYPPALVTPEGYTCSCNEFVTLGDFVPLTTLIVKRPKYYNYALLNTPVQCPNCGRFLAIPEMIISVLEPLITDLIKEQEISIKNFALYRPPVTQINSIIPPDLKYLFNLDCSTVLEFDTLHMGRKECLAMYLQLVDLWMCKKEQEIVPVELPVISEANLLAQVIYNSKRIEYIFNNLEVPFDLRKDIVEFTHTLIYHLETLGCFAITSKALAFYQYCEKNGIKRYAYPKEQAIEWLTDNAWALVGLKSVVQGSVLDIPEEILPEYIPVLNYIYMIRVLAMSEEHIEKSNYHKWVTHPSTNSATDFISSLKQKSHSKNKLLHNLVNSERDFADIPIVYSARSYICSYSLIIETSEKNPINDRYLSEDMIDYIGNTLFQDYEEYYGHPSPENSTNKYLIEPVYRFDDFIKVFKEIGAHLFFSASSTRVYIERAKILTLALTQNRLTNSFKQSIKAHNNLKYLLTPKPVTEAMMKNNLKEVILLSDSRVPEELVLLRDALSKKEYLKVALEANEIIQEDGKLVEVYPEVFA